MFVGQCDEAVRVYEIVNERIFLRVKVQKERNRNASVVEAVIVVSDRLRQGISNRTGISSRSSRRLGFE